MINCSFSSFSPVYACNSNCHNSTITTFQSLIFWTSYLLISAHNISKNEKDPWTSLIHLPDSYRHWLFSNSLCINIRWLECLSILKTKKVQKCLSRKTGVFTEFTFCYIDKLSVLNLDFLGEYLYCIKTFKELYPFGKWYISDLTK